MAAGTCIANAMGVSTRRPKDVRSSPAALPVFRDDVIAFNRWLCVTRMRAAVPVLVFGLAMKTFGVGGLRWTPVLLLVAGLALFSAVALALDLGRRWPWTFHFVQLVVDVSAITAGIGLALSGTPALLFRLLLVLVIIPASFTSVGFGLLAATMVSCGHLLLLGIQQGFSLGTFGSLEALAPVLLFYLVAQQSFFYATHLENKNIALAELATSLAASRERLAGLVQVARTLNSTMDPTELLGRINLAVLEQLRADWSATFLVDQDNQTFRAAAVSDPSPSEDAGHLEIPLSAWPPMHRLSSERLVALTGDECASLPAGLAGERRFALVFLAGLYRDEVLAGALVLGYQDETTSSAAVSEDLTAIVEHATIALRNAQLLEEARQASALKSEFLSTVSHELRTPLNVILGYNEMLREGVAGPLTANQLDFFERIDARSRELFDLIEATLCVNRLEMGRGGINVAAVSFADLVDSLRSTVSTLPVPAGLALDWELPPRLEGRVSTDRAKMVLTVRNLVSNAIKFTPKGRVVVRIMPQDSNLVVEVSDTGIGIAPEHLPQIFDMFRQVGSEAQRPRGVGLGLYIVKQVTERLRGKVEVESALGNGSTFRITIPGYAAAAPPASGIEDVSSPEAA